MDNALNEDQAAAVYSAMCCLNNVAGRADFTIGLVRVEMKEEGSISVFMGEETINSYNNTPYIRHNEVERFANQAQFAKAYGVD